MRDGFVRAAAHGRRKAAHFVQIGGLAIAGTTCLA
jgi:hypothetical protein